MVIDRHLLTHCPNLVDTQIVDDTVCYNWRDVKTCLPARLPSLESLTLTGWPALTFRSETFHSTNRLKLSITSYALGSDQDTNSWDGVDDFTDLNCYIPPMEDPYQSYGLQNDSSTIPLTPAPAYIRPKWAWDWHLPHFVSLELSSELPSCSSSVCFRAIPPYNPSSSRKNFHRFT